jgi:PAS domain S-box-containing protein
LRQANEQMRTSEARFRLMISEVKDYAIFMLDTEGRVVTWNAGAKELKGWEAEEIIGEHFSRFYPLEEVAKRKPERELEMAKAEGRFEEEGWRVRKDGSRFLAKVLITPLHDEEGRLTGFAKVTRDMTEYRRIEKAVKEEEARLAAVIGSAMDAVVTVDDKHCITLFNPAAERMFGCSAAEAMGRPLDQFMPERYRGTHGAHIEAFGRTNTTRRKMGGLGAIYGLRSNGEEFPIEASISQVQVGEQRMFSVILRDITERKLAEEELRQQASLLGLGTVLVRDMKSRIVFWSAGAAKLYKYSMEEALGKISHDILQTEFPEPLAQIEKTVRENGSWEGELVHHTGDGGKVVVASQWVQYHDAGGKPIRILEFNADITARKRAEEAQLRSQKLEGLGTLAGGIAHDFNNILLAINGNTKLAIADLAPDNPAQESLAEIAKASARATDLVRRILAFSRPQEMKREVLHLQPVVEEALKLVRATLPATIEFRTEFACDLPTVVADGTQIHQVIVNLATNAAHAIGEKNGVIEFRLDTATVGEGDTDPCAEMREGEYVRLYVSDNGCGMERATLSRIFDPFFTTKGPGEGTGLGLSVVHGIMTNHGGTVRVYSEPGRGTAFHLYFPAVGREVETMPKPTQEMECGRHEHILYVDDEEPLVFLATRMLERLGYKVTGHTDAAKALEEFRARPRDFDVVVTDLSMPKMSGFALARELLATRADVPIVLTSGYVRPEDQERALEMGLRDLILKPNTIEQLGRTLDQLFHPESSVSKGGPAYRNG